jgi:hypothetical protein
VDPRAIQSTSRRSRVNTRGHATHVRPDATTNVVRPLEKCDIESGLREQVGRVQARDTRPHDGYRHRLVCRLRAASIGRDQSACGAAQKATSGRSRRMGTSASFVLAPGSLERVAKTREKS